MSNIFGVLPGIGELIIKDTYLEYDDYVLTHLCLCNGRRFMAHAIGSHEDDEWLLVPISDVKLIKMLKDEISFKNIFTEPEYGFIWKVRKSKDTAILGYMVYTPADIPIQVLLKKDSPLKMDAQEAIRCINNLSGYTDIQHNDNSLVIYSKIINGVQNFQNRPSIESTEIISFLMDLVNNVLSPAEHGTLLN